MRIGGPGKVEGLGELLEGGQRLALVGEPAGLFARQRLPGVPCRERHELTALPALRDVEADMAPALVGQERLDVGGIRRQEGHVHLAGNGARARVVLREEAAEHLLVGRLAGRVHQVHVPPDQLPVADGEQLGRGLTVLARHPEQVELRARERGHLLALHRPLDGPDLVAQDARAFVFGLVGRGGHLAPKRPDDDLLATLQEQLDLLDVRPVVGLRDGLDARTLAALDVVEQARPLERALAVTDVDRAGPEREQPPDEVHRLVHRRRGCVRPEVARTVVHELARSLDAREVVGERDLDVRVALVVLEPDVEPRPEPLDEVRLEQQGLGHRVGQRVLDVGDAVDHFPDPVDVAQGTRRRLLLPVRAHPAAQALRLADVQHVAALVLEQVDARPVGQSLEGRLELRGHRPMLGQVRDSARRASDGRRVQRMNRTNPPDREPESTRRAERDRCPSSGVRPSARAAPGAGLADVGREGGKPFVAPGRRPVLAIEDRGAFDLHEGRSSERRTRR